MSWLARANELGDKLADTLLTRSTLDIVRILTLLVLIQHGPKDWYVRVPLTILVLFGIIVRELRAKPWFWFVIASFILSHDIVTWPGVDNHKWLMGWWTGAMWMVHLAPQASQLAVMKVNARLMLGLVFTLATLWKIWTPQYMEGSFFEYELLADKRFKEAAIWVGGATDEGLDKNRDMKNDLLTSYRKDAEPLEFVGFESGEYVDLLAVGMTWWTIAIEGALGVLALWPGNGMIAIARTLVALAFTASTYLLAPVMGFGWMVIILGFGQCPERYKKLRVSFLFVLAIIYVYRMNLVDFGFAFSEQEFSELVRFY
jgi:hypothetical protein